MIIFPFQPSHFLFCSSDIFLCSSVSCLLLAFRMFPWTCGISAAVVPGLGANLDMLIMSGFIFCINFKVSSNCFSVSVGCPTMMSVLIVISGISFLNVLTISSNVSTVCPLFMAFNTSLFPDCTGMCRNLNIFGCFIALMNSGRYFAACLGFPMPTLIMKSPGTSAIFCSSSARFFPVSNP